jgi:hypothetical protein
MEGGLLLDVVVRKGAAILQLLTGEDQPLLVRGDSCRNKTKSLVTTHAEMKWNRERRRRRRRTEKKRHTLLVLDLSLDIVDGIAALNLEGDGLPREGLHEDLHFGRGL